MQISGNSCKKNLTLKIPFNKPYITGQELEFIQEAINSGYISGNGPFTHKCENLLYKSGDFGKVLFTTSCTDALEMASLLLDMNKGDEVIVPAFTFVSTALAFTRQGARIIFADSRIDNPCIDETKIEGLITSKTKAIVPVHYSGQPCEMDLIMKIAEKYNLFVIEDAAHAFKSRYKGKALGTIGHLGCFSFHETKIIQCGEGGMLSVNDKKLSKRAEIIWEKGTNRCDFQRGNINYYEWIDTGSSFLMSDLNAAFLYAQIRNVDKVILKRKILWEEYYNRLFGAIKLGILRIPELPSYVDYNYSGFYIITRTLSERNDLILILNDAGIQALTHYRDLSESPYILKNQSYPAAEVFNCKKYQECLLRLPLFFDLAIEDIYVIANLINDYYKIV